MSNGLFITFILALCLITTEAFSQDRQGLRVLGHWDDPKIEKNPGGAAYNEVWGFEQNGDSYAVIGSTYGTHIIYLHPNGSPQEVASIPGNAQGTYIVHRDFDDYQGFLYAVCDESPSKLQIIDIRNLPERADLIYESDAFFTTAHNISIDKTRGRAYVSGPSGHAMTILDLTQPSAPQLIRHFDLLDYIHDVYVRNDTAYLHAAFQGLSVWDFSNPDQARILGSLDTYPDQGYNHSGWLNESGQYYVFADETPGKKLKICDVSDLSNIEVLDLFNSGVSNQAVAHNVMIKGNTIYVSHYADGIRLFDMTQPEHVVQTAWYDTYPQGYQGYPGAWGVYALLSSGQILVSDRQSGLWVFSEDPQLSLAGKAQPEIFPNPGDGRLTISMPELAFSDATYQVYNDQGKIIRSGKVLNNAPAQWIALDLSHEAQGLYLFELKINNTFYHLKYLKM